MKKLLYLFIATSIFLASCSKDCSTPESQEEWLFVHTAVSAQILNATTIEIPVTKKILAFTDRPYRKQYYMTAQQYADLWTHSGDNCFKEDPPNAVLTWADGEEMKEVEVVITNAVSDSSTIIYTINDTSAVIAGDIMNASLFVDGQNSLLEIGDTYGGGIVFYLDQGNGGLIAAPSNQATDPYGSMWGSCCTHTGASGTAIGTGAQNTMDIGTRDPINWGAAYLCRSLTLGGYGDWFLPSVDELKEMHKQRTVLGMCGNCWYWSSTEVDTQGWQTSEDYAYTVPFTDGAETPVHFPEGKNNTGSVRAIRHFWFSPYSYE
jgi:hypothetical protein